MSGSTLQRLAQTVRGRSAVRPRTGAMYFTGPTDEAASPPEVTAERLAPAAGSPPPRRSVANLPAAERPTSAVPVTGPRPDVRPVPVAAQDSVSKPDATDGREPKADAASERVPAPRSTPPRGEAPAHRQRPSRVGLPAERERKSQPDIEPTAPLLPEQPERDARGEPAAATGRRAVVEPEPSIEVSIGRIEVRATPMPQPAVQRHREPPAFMTLEHYLQGKREGRR